MKYKLELEFNGTPNCETCVLSYHKFNDIPISKKKRNCKGGDECEVFLRTIKLRNRIDLLNGISSVTFICGDDGLIINDYTE